MNTGANIVINNGMTAAQVATAMATAMDRVFAPANNPATSGIFVSSKVDGNNLQIYGNTVTNQINITPPNGGGNAIPEGEFFSINNNFYSSSKPRSRFPVSWPTTTA